MQQLNRLDKQLDIIIKLFTLSFKIGILIGGSALLFYCLKIGYFPEGVSIGDGLVLILIAIAFGGIYLFFVACLTSLGIFLRPAWSMGQIIYSWILSKYNTLFNKRKSFEPFEFIKGDFSLFFLALLGLLMIWGFGLSEPKVVITLLLSCFGCALLAGKYKKNNDRLAELEFDQNAVIQSSGGATQNVQDFKEIGRIKKHQVQLVFGILIAPLLIGGISDKLLVGSMTLIKVRGDNSIIHIKTPYSTLIEKDLGINGGESTFGAEYKSYKNLKVLMHGIGTNTFIEVPTNENTNPKKIAVPKSDIYVVWQ